MPPNRDKRPHGPASSRSSPPELPVQARMKTHSDIEALVARIRRETRCVVPDVDPEGAGVGARVAMIMLTPGPAEGGAQMTRILSPTTNSDQSALNLRKLMQEASLSERRKAAALANR